MARAITARFENAAYLLMFLSLVLPWRLDTPGSNGLPTFQVAYADKSYKLVIYAGTSVNVFTLWLGVIQGQNLHVLAEWELSSLAPSAVKELLEKAEDLILSPMSRLAIQCRSRTGHANSVGKLG